MAYRIDQNGNKTQSPLTAGETTAFKNWAATPFGAAFVAGITDAAQLAGVLNKPQSPANPQPQGSVPVASIDKSDVQKLMVGIVGGVMKQSQAAPTDATLATKLAYWQWVLEQVNSYAGDSYTAADAAGTVAEALTEGLLTQAQATALTSTPDAAYVPTWDAGPLAPLVFGTWLVVETSDGSLLLAN